MFKKRQNSGDISKGSEKARKTKQRILDTSLRLFQQHGYNKTTLREIAKEANISLGSTYYYFKNKEEIVLFFYQTSLERSLQKTEEIFQKKISLEKKLNKFFQFKFQELGPYRNFLQIISQSSLNPKASISPFSKENSAIRNRMIQIFEQVVETEKLSLAKEIKPIVATLIWYLQMTLLLYWLNDSSAQQKNTEKLSKKILKLFFLFLQFSNLSLLRPFNKAILEVFQLLGAVYEPNETTI